MELTSRFMISRLKLIDKRVSIFWIYETRGMDAEASTRAFKYM